MNLNYVGNELDLFSAAENWKRYWFSRIVPYVGDSVLEVGAGIGTNSAKILSMGCAKNRLDCIEPDPNLANQIIPNIIATNQDPAKVFVASKFLSDYNPDTKYDSILYIDVIEHIEDDKKEIKLALKFLKPGGHLIILVPAHNFLYSPFDKSIGHFRRYNRKSLKSIIPSEARIIRCDYLDSVGMLASLSNKLFLKQSYPTLKQILLWDHKIVPISKIIDSLINYRIGKSLLMICERDKHFPS